MLYLATFFANYLYLLHNLLFMLTIDQLRKDTTFAKERLAHKRFKDIQFVDEIIMLDDSRKSIKSKLDDFLAQRNSISKEIIMLVTLNFSKTVINADVRHPFLYLKYLYKVRMKNHIRTIKR